MEFYHLRSFVIVAKTGNLTAAAKQLFTTPPAISAHIKSLEEELKTPLFIRSSKGMSLTDKGMLLLPQAEKTLSSAIDMVNLAAENQNEIIGEFTLGINQSPIQLKVPMMLNNIQENCSGINIHIENLSTGAAIDALNNNTIDGAYVYENVNEDLFGLPIKEQHITTIAPINSLLTSESLLPELAQQPWITMGNHCPFDSVLKIKLKKFTHANINTSHDETRLQLVKAKHGLSFLENEDAQVAKNEKTVKILPQLNFKIKLYFVVKLSRINEPVIKTILKEIEGLWDHGN